jgi:tRNA wybutosine-synthesizing protein 3
MIQDKFLVAKNGRLGREDNSSIGEIDKPILGLCNKINNSNDYYTLSSCSGRIILIKEVPEKEAGLFLFRSHKKVSFSEIKKELEKAAKTTKDWVYLKQEACVLALSCRNIEKEQEILDKAKNAGWKRSGITTTSKKFIVELFSTERMDVPIMNDGNVLVDDEYLKLIVKEANSKLERTWKKIERLEKEF